MLGTFSYDPSKVAEGGKDQMRFELGDVIVAGQGQAAALTDEEYDAIIAKYPNSWKKAKLKCVASILFRFAYEVDEKVGPASWNLDQRYQHWKALYDELEEEVKNSSVPVVNPGMLKKPHYFREGMHNNLNNGGTEKGIMGGGKRV